MIQLQDAPRSALREFRGYTDEEATRKKVLSGVFEAGDKYFRSGDLMRYDEYDYFYFVDRIGDTYRWKGENVSTAEVGELVSKAPGVLEATVVGVPVPGMEYVRSRVAGRGTYDGSNKPFVDFNAVVAGTDKTRGFVVDDRGFANIILGRGIPPPPPTDKGHFHTESSEFWFILLGQIRYTIEGLPTFIADQGDIVYVPKQRWHLASFAGDGQSARLAMNGYPDLAHSFEAAEGR